MLFVLVKTLVLVLLLVVVLPVKLVSLFLWCRGGVGGVGVSVGDGVSV